MLKKPHNFPDDLLCVSHMQKPNYNIYIWHTYIYAHAHIYFCRYFNANLSICMYSVEVGVKLPKIRFLT